MQLYEHQGKALLTRAGLPIPRGGLWPEIPPDVRFPVAAKSQVLGGGRGKQGAIRRVDSPTGLEAVVRVLEGARPDGEQPAAVLVEEWVEVDRECYLAVMVDRDRRAPLLLVGAQGGIDVEQGAAPLSLQVDPWLGPRAHHDRLVADVLEVSVPTAAGVLEGIWSTFETEDALLVEVNPLGVRDGAVVALDARIFLDDNARFRHDGWPRNPTGTPFETACAELGASGVELDGDIAVITSGAGLAMASLDLVVALGGRPRAIVDLGPVVFQQPDRIASLMPHLAALRPRVVLLNLFLQLARCDTIALGVAPALIGGPWERVVVRMRGVHAEEARGLLEPLGAMVYEDLDQALRAAVDGGGRR